MTYGEKRKVVSFALDKPSERVLYDLAASINFSAFVKRHLMSEARLRGLVGRTEITVHVGEE